MKKNLSGSIGISQLLQLDDFELANGSTIPGDATSSVEEWRI